MSDILIKEPISSWHAGMDDTADFAAEQRAHAVFVAEQLNAARQRGPITAEEARGMQNSIQRATESESDDDQSLSADRMVIGWMAQAAMRALAVVAVVFIGWNGMNALLGLLAEALKP